MRYSLLMTMALLGFSPTNLYAQEDAGPIGDGIEEGAPSSEAPPSLGEEDEMEGAEYNASYAPSEASSPTLQPVGLEETFSPDENEEEMTSSEADASPRVTETISLSDKSGVAPLTGVHHMPTAPASLMLPGSLAQIDSSNQKPQDEGKKKDDSLKKKLQKKKGDS